MTQPDCPIVSGPLSSTRAVERAIELLAQVCDRGEISLAESARRTGLAPSTALRLLRTLEASQLISRDDRGLFRAGPRLIQLGAAALGTQSLVGMAQPALQRIVQSCRETAYLYLPGPANTAIYAGMVEGLHSIRRSAWVGRSIPMAGTAAGAAFRDEVDAVGYVVIRSAVERDVTAIAAPVRCSSYPFGSIGGSVVVAALSVVGPAYRLDEDQAASIGQMVRSEADALTQQLAALRCRHQVARGDSDDSIDPPSTSSKRVPRAAGAHMAVLR